MLKAVQTIAYETGTGTATRTGFTETPGGGTITSTYHYTKIGRLVFLNITLSCSGGATIGAGPSGTAAFINLPFTSPQYAIGEYMNTSNLSTTGPVGMISTTMYVCGAGFTASSDPYSFSVVFNV